jgi:hypothetical protein
VAISVALPAFAQRSIPDPQLREKVVAAIKKHIAALDKNDAAAGAANFTENGILVTPDGPIFGRESIEKYYEGEFKQVQLSDNLAPVDDDSPHAIGSAGKEMWATGKWSASVSMAEPPYGFKAGRSLFWVTVVICLVSMTGGHRSKSTATSTTTQIGIVQTKSEITASTART